MRAFSYMNDWINSFIRLGTADHVLSWTHQSAPRKTAQQLDVIHKVANGAKIKRRTGQIIGGWGVGVIAKSPRKTEKDPFWRLTLRLPRITGTWQTCSQSHLVHSIRILTLKKMKDLEDILISNYTIPYSSKEQKMGKCLEGAHFQGRGLWSFTPHITSPYLCMDRQRDRSKECFPAYAEAH